MKCGFSLRWNLTLSHQRGPPAHSYCMALSLSWDLPASSTCSTLTRSYHGRHETVRNVPLGRMRWRFTEHEFRVALPEKDALSRDLFQAGCQAAFRRQMLSLPFTQDIQNPQICLVTADVSPGVLLNSSGITLLGRCWRWIVLLQIWI